MGLTRVFRGREFEPWELTVDMLIYPADTASLHSTERGLIGRSNVDWEQARGIEQTRYMVPGLDQPKARAESQARAFRAHGHGVASIAIRSAVNKSPEVAWVPQPVCG